MSRAGVDVTVLDEWFRKAKETNDKLSAAVKLVEATGQDLKRRMEGERAALARAEKLHQAAKEALVAGFCRGRRSSGL